MIAAHTDVVGSLLRPAALRKARDDRVAGRLGYAQFKAIEDRAVDAAVSLQEAAGLDIVTDGEMRRLSFQSQMTEAVDGFGAWDINAFMWGHWHGDGIVGERRRERPANLGVVSRLVRKRHLAAEEFVYLRGRTSRIAKVTLPSPSLFVNFWSPERSQAAYSNLEHFLADIVAILRASGKQAGLSRWSAWRSVHNAASPLRSLETTSPSRTRDASSRRCARPRDGYGDDFLLLSGSGRSLKFLMSAEEFRY